MTIRKRNVRVAQVPEQPTAREVSIFLEELQKCAEAERPCLVLDCSMISEMTRGKINVLLCCLEEVLKCNGDVRLASLQPKAEAELRMSGVDLLFETFTTAEDAVQSFHDRSTSLALALESEFADRTDEKAA